MTLSDAYDLMTEEERKRAFFFLWELVEFYGDGDTWFAVCLLPDPPAGRIMTDMHWSEDLNRKAPGGRARIGLIWVWQLMKRAGLRSPHVLPEDSTKGER